LTHDLGIVKTSVEEGVSELSDLRKDSSQNNKDLTDLIQSFNNFAENYSKNFRGLKKKLAEVAKDTRGAPRA
jgi:uncharacterized phage infection (PIP) family protein YhgE